MLPVAFPDEGTFDWLDTFLAKNPHYVELSDRKILEWAVSSGLWKPKTTGWKTSNDKPEFNFGLPGMDDLSIRRVINAVAPVVPRNYVIMEVKSNLVATERSDVLRRFSAPHFKKVGHVVMGEPSEEFKQVQLDKLVKEKQDKADIAWRAKKAEEKRKKEIEKRQKQLTEMRKQADEARKKAAEEAKKKAEEAKKKAEEVKRKAEAKKKAEEAKDEKMEVDEAKEEVKEEEEEKKDVEMEEEEEETEPPKVELTEEEKQMWFRRSAGSCVDLTSTVLNQSFGSFSIPEKSEGFDELRYEWQNGDESKDYLRKWVLDKKRTSRMEELQPGQWFQDKVKEWQKLFAEWQAKQKVYKTSAAQKEKEAAAKKAAEEKKEGEEGENKEEELPVEDQTLDVDIMMVDDVCDVGNSEPLFKDFGFEDWAMLQLRYELYLLQIAFKKDVNDPERVGVHENHLSFYYNKYFRKQLTPKSFNVATNQEMAALVKDAIGWDAEEKVLTTTLEEELDGVNIFVKLTEENRRERQRRIDAGDETARLKFSPLAIQQPTNPKAPGAAPSGSIRPAGQSWAGSPTAKAWPGAGAGAGGKGAIYPQTGFRPTGAWGGGGQGWGAGRRW